MVIKIGIPTEYWNQIDELPYPLWKRPPEWIKSGDYGLSHCPVTRNTLQKTIVVPHTTDTNVRFDGEFRVDWKERNGTEVRFHREHEFSGMTEDHVSVKFAPPFTLLCDTVVQFTPAFLHEVPTLGSPMYGMVNVPGKMKCAVNCLYPTNQFYLHEIPKGHPMCYLTFPNIEGKVEVDMVKYDGDPMSDDPRAYHL